MTGMMHGSSANDTILSIFIDFVRTHRHVLCNGDRAASELQHARGHHYSGVFYRKQKRGMASLEEWLPVIPKSNSAVDLQ